MLPTGTLCVVSEHKKRVRVCTLRNVIFFEERNEVFYDDCVSVLLVEWSDIGDEGGGQKNITNDDLQELA